MSTGSSVRGAVEVPAVSSVLNDPDATKIDNKEDDAALVDSFFLPGGLFSDESNNNHQNESKITNSNPNLKVDSIPHTMTSRSSVHLPKNPWETETTSNTITAQSTNATTGYDDTNFNNITGNINHFNFNSPCRDGEEEIITGTTIVETSPFHQQIDSIFPLGNQNQEGNIDSIMTNRMNNSKSVVRPPPGFQNGPTVIPSVDTTHATNLSQQQYQTGATIYSNRKSMEFLATTSTSSTGNKNLFLSSDDHRETVTGENLLVAVDDSGDAQIQTSDLSDIPMNYPLHTFQQNASMPSNDTKAIGVEIPKLNVPACSVQSAKYDNEESNSYLARYLKKPTQSKNTSDRNNRKAGGALEALAFPITIGSKGKSQKSNDFIEDGDNDDDAEAHVQEEDTEENSIPLNICVSIGAESNSSSLSTCSEVDNNSELSSYASGNIHYINDDHFKDEGVEHDTDQAHVSQIVGVMGNSVCSAVGNDEIDEIPDDQQSTSPAPSVNSEGTTRIIPSVNGKFHHSYNDQKNSNFTVEKTIIFLRSTLEICHGLSDHALSAMQRSLLNAKATKRYERFSRQMRKLSRDFHNFTNWLMDVEEVFAVLLRRLLKVSWKYSRDITETLVIIFSFLFQLLKFGLIEAIEEFSGVTSCYIVFYLMPRICVMLMDFINLPHWTPHSVTWLAIFSLCHQVEAGTLHETSNYTMSSLISKLSIDSSEIPGTTSNNGIAAESTFIKSSTQQSPPRQQDDGLSRAQDKQVCFLLLKILKTVLPVLYMVEGFSSEFGTMIGASSTNRLTTAFVLSILRKSLLSSPIGWVSWALQVLLAAYYSSSIFLDILILLIGLSSIRLIRFLDLQRTRGKRGYERLNK